MSLVSIINPLSLSNRHVSNNLPEHRLVAFGAYVVDHTASGDGAAGDADLQKLLSCTRETPKIKNKRGWLLHCDWDRRSGRWKFPRLAHSQGVMPCRITCTSTEYSEYSVRHMPELKRYATPSCLIMFPFLLEGCSLSGT
jgi:hypothetical protein